MLKISHRIPGKGGERFLGIGFLDVEGGIRKLKWNYIIFEKHRKGHPEPYGYYRSCKDIMKLSFN